MPLLRTASTRILDALDRLPPSRAATGLMLLALVVTLATFDPRVEIGGDNALYWALATSLAQGRGYLDLVAPGAPPETSVPWGYPALLAGPIALGASYAQAKLVGVVSMVGAVGCLFAMARRLFEGRQGLAVLATLLVVVDHRVMGFASAMLSEAPYMLLSLAALWTFDRHTDARAAGGGARASIALPALLAGAAYLVRPAGISLVVALLGLLAWTRRWRDLGVATAVLALVMGSWHLWAALTPSTAENLYLDYLLKQDKFQADDAVIGPLGFLARLWTNAVAYTTQIMPRFVLGWSWPDRGMGPLVPPFLLAVAAGWLSGLRRPRLLHLYLPLYLGVLLAWLPESVNARYFAVGFPLMVVLAVQGLWQVAARWRVAGTTLLVAACLAGVGFRIDHLVGRAISAAGIRAEVAAGDPIARAPEPYRSYLDMARRLGATTPPDAVLAGRKPRMAWFFSGRSALRLPNGDDPQQLMAWLDQQGVDYLLIDRIDDIRGRNPSTQDRFLPVVQAWPERFVQVDQGADGDRVLQVLPADPAPPDSEREHPAALGEDPPLGDGLKGAAGSQVQRPPG